jgi:hypothetical protein
MPDLAPKTIADKRARLERLRRTTVRTRVLAGVLLAVEVAAAVTLLLARVHA